MKNVVKQLQPNLLGRDFVIGDLHGSLSCLVNLLDNVSFDPTVDRLISVGDLVDRGPDSLGCLELLYEPWFHAVLSNHEQMMLEAFQGGYMGQFWLRNGGMWGIEALNDWRNKQSNLLINVDGRPPQEDSVRLWNALELVEQLPLLLTINMKDGKKFHVIHSELPPFYPEKITDTFLADSQKVLELSSQTSEDGMFILWGRHLFYNFFRAQLDNVEKLQRTVQHLPLSVRGVFNDELSHIISGHTIMQRPLTILGQTNIDTGAYGSYLKDAKKWEALTAVELGTWTFYQATEKDFRVVEPTVVNRA